jgi:hypothetical protein
VTIADLDEAKLRMLRLALNRLGEDSGWDVAGTEFSSDRGPSLSHRSRLANFCVLSSMSTAMPRFESSTPTSFTAFMALSRRAS